MSPQDEELFTRWFEGVGAPTPEEIILPLPKLLRLKCRQAFAAGILRVLDGMFDGVEEIVADARKSGGSRIVNLENK